MNKIFKKQGTGNKGQVFFYFLFFVLCSLFFALPVLAQTQPPLDLGLEYGGYTGLVDTDVRIIVARIIRAALGLLGIVALALVVYGGYEYMTAGGNEEQVGKAKKILLNAVIGLAIILSSFAITQFVLGKLTDAIVGNYCVQYPADPACDAWCQSHPADCAVIPPIVGDFYGRMAPTGQLEIKNVVLSFVFLQGSDLPAGVNFSTVDRDTLKIYKKADNSQPPGKFKKINDGLVEFHPAGSCLDSQNPANSDPAETCFEKNTTYKAELTADIKSADGRSLDCSLTHPCNFEFVTGEKIDVLPPAIQIFYPADNQIFQAGTAVEIKASFSDDAGVKLVEFFRGSVKIGSVLLNPSQKSGEAKVSWNTAGLFGIFQLNARADDVDSHQTSSNNVNVQIKPAHCFNQIKDGDETGVDCGGSCGACSGGDCQTSSDCAGTYCDQQTKTCVSRPKILNIGPFEGRSGNYISIVGENFGDYNSSASKAVFLGTTKTSADDKIAEIVSCEDRPNWQNSLVVVKVPAGASSGPIQIQTAGYTGPSDVIHQDKSNDDWGPPLSPPLAWNAPANDLSKWPFSGGTKITASPADVVLPDETKARPNFIENLPAGGWIYDFVQPYEIEGKKIKAVVWLKSDTAGQKVSLSLQGAQMSPFKGVNETGGATTVNLTDRWQKVSLEHFFSVKDNFNNDHVRLVIASPAAVLRNLYVWGAVINDESVFPLDKKTFVVNDEARPGLSCAAPVSARPFQTIQVKGSNLGDQAGNSEFKFGDFKATVGSWSNSVLSGVLVPNLPPQVLSLSAKVGGKASNFLPFTVLALGEANNLPKIDYLEPAAGPKGGYFTVIGENFGTTVGRVIFKKGASEFWSELPPDYCAETWTPNQIVAKVAAQEWVTSGKADVFVETAIGRSNGMAFNIVDGRPAPGLCQIEPDNGPAKTAVTLKGEYFGNSGKVQYWQNVTSSLANCMALDGSGGSCQWSGTQVKDKVPLVAKTGPVKIWSDEQGLYGNTLNFKVQDCREELKKGKTLSEICGAGEKCCGNGSCQTTCPEEAGLKQSVYAWSFSTGKLPIVPKVVEECKSGSVPSPTPSQFWPPAEKICLNSRVMARFTAGIDSATLNKDWSVFLQTCNENCFSESAVWSNANFAIGGDILSPQSWAGNMNLDDYQGQVVDALSIWPAAVNSYLEKNKWYRVILTTDIKSFGWDKEKNVLDSQLAANMPSAPSGICPNPPGKTAAYCFNFKTDDSDELCKLGSAVVSPDGFVAKEFNKTYYPGEETLYQVTALAKDNACWVINAADYDWQWSAGSSPGGSSVYAEVSNDKSDGKGSPRQDLITKGKETPVAGEKVWVKTVSYGNLVQDSAVLHVAPQKPKAVNYWPNCDFACVNAQIGVQFNQAMENPSTSAVFGLCEISGLEENCDSEKIFQPEDWETQSGNIIILEPQHQLNPNQYYRVIIKGGENGLKGANGGQMDKDFLNYDCDGQGKNCQDFSWIFKTKNDSSDCDIDRVEIQPASSAVKWIGASSFYRSLAYGPKDECSPLTGQLLNGADYNWNWTSANSALAEVSICQNGIKKDELACEAGAGDNKTDPMQYATAKSPPSGLAQTGAAQYLTQILAKAFNAANQEKAGAADFILQCGYQTANANCPAASDSDKGVGKNSCCYPRPQAELIQPAVSSNVCPNTAITLKFNQLMDASSFSSSTLGYYNLVLAESSTAAVCPAGTYLAGREEIAPQNLWQKIKFWAGRLLGREAGAEIYCAGGVSYSLESKTVVESGQEKTQASFILKKPLAGEKNYRIVVAHPWVKSAVGVSLAQKREFNFSTRKDICKIEKIIVEPLFWWFKTLKNEADDDPQDTAVFDTKEDVDKVFTASAYTKQNVPDVPLQELQSMADVYSWNYQWSVADETIVKKDALPGEDKRIKITAQNKNGLTQAGATARVEQDNSSFSASSTVQVFVCENPWPDGVFNPARPEYGLGYVDAEGTDDKDLDGQDLGVGRGWTNFKMFYCRDSGQANNTNDDLSALRSPAVLYHQNDPPDPILKEFFFTFEPSPDPAKPNNKNGIGLRVYPNLDHLSLIDWYNSQPWIPKGAPAPIKIGPYEAMQEGRSYYLNGVNLANGNLYSNIYVFSFSDNPRPETLNIVNQLLANFTLNVNSSAEDKTAFYSDFRRLQDLQTIATKLSSYFGKNQSSYPKLTENPQLGTYLPSYTNSKWKSWQGVLGNLLGYTLPTDPINQFYGCGSSTLKIGNPEQSLGNFDSETCWNANASQFACPTGSYLYQYETSGGVSAVLKVQLERPNYTWVNDINASKPANLANTLSYRLQNTCNDDVYGIGGKCGDGIIGPDEECEAGQTDKESCAPDIPYHNYFGLRQKKCKNDCSGWENVGAGACVAQGKCRDGIIQTGPNPNEPAEVCDDGANNGKYGYCSSNCLTFGSGGYCGNLNVEGGKEICDSSNWSTLQSSPLKGWCSKDNLTACSVLIGTTCGIGKGECVFSGAKYAREQTNSCSWDCQSYDYCGDGKINPDYEQCEKSESCSVGRCSADSGSLANKYCEKNNDCGSVPGAVCQNYQPGKKYCQVSSEKKWEKVPIGDSVTYKDSADLYPSNECQRSIPSSDFNKANDNVSCLPLTAVEQVYLPNNCGNGKIDAGEVCDNGKANGDTCLPQLPASTCTYCAFGCQQVITVSQ